MCLRDWLRLYHIQSFVNLWFWVEKIFQLVVEYGRILTHQLEVDVQIVIIFWYIYLFYGHAIVWKDSMMKPPMKPTPFTVMRRASALTELLYWAELLSNKLSKILIGRCQRILAFYMKLGTKIPERTTYHLVELLHFQSQWVLGSCLDNLLLLRNKLSWTKNKMHSYVKKNRETCAVLTKSCANPSSKKFFDGIFNFFSFCCLSFAYRYVRLIISSWLIDSRKIRT